MINTNSIKELKTPSNDMKFLISEPHNGKVYSVNSSYVAQQLGQGAGASSYTVSETFDSAAITGGGGFINSTITSPAGFRVVPSLITVTANFDSIAYISGPITDTAFIIGSSRITYTVDMDLITAEADAAQVLVPTSSLMNEDAAAGAGGFPLYSFSFTGGFGASPTAGDGEIIVSMTYTLLPV